MVAGLGVAIVSRLTVELELSAGRLVQVTTPGLSVRRALHLLTHEHRLASPAAAEFLAFLRSPQSGLLA